MQWRDQIFFLTICLRYEERTCETGPWEYILNFLMLTVRCQTWLSAYPHRELNDLYPPHSYIFPFVSALETASQDLCSEFCCCLLPQRPRTSPSFPLLDFPQCNTHSELFYLKKMTKETKHHPPTLCPNLRYLLISGLLFIAKCTPHNPLIPDFCLHHSTESSHIQATNNSGIIWTVLIPLALSIAFSIICTLGDGGFLNLHCQALLLPWMLLFKAISSPADLSSVPPPRLHLWSLCTLSEVSLRVLIHSVPQLPSKV